MSEVVCNKRHYLRVVSRITLKTCECYVFLTLVLHRIVCPECDLFDFLGRLKLLSFCPLCLSSIFVYSFIAFHPRLHGLHMSTCRAVFLNLCETAAR